MRKVGDGVVHGGTFTAHSVALAAANKTLQILDETDALATIQKYGEDLQAGLSGILTARGIEHSFVGHPSMMGLFFSDKAPVDYRDWVNTNYEFYNSLALAETLDKFETAVDITMKKANTKQGSLRSA